jgi:hypothetical protein
MRVHPLGDLRGRRIAAREDEGLLPLLGKNLVRFLDSVNHPDAKTQDLGKLNGIETCVDAHVFSGACYLVQRSRGGAGLGGEKK